MAKGLVKRLVSSDFRALQVPGPHSKKTGQLLASGQHRLEAAKTMRNEMISMG